MEKEFVTYEVALALKEFGFDEKCFCCFDNEKELRTCIGLNNWNNHEGFPLFVSCPLKQQVFRWFREKYDLHSYLDEVGYYGYTFHIDNKSYHSNDGYTYEEAENACIDKLIEIAKHQDNDTKRKSKKFI